MKVLASPPKEKLEWPAPLAAWLKRFERKDDKKRTIRRPTRQKVRGWHGSMGICALKRRFDCPRVTVKCKPGPAHTRMSTSSSSSKSFLLPLLLLAPNGPFNVDGTARI